MSLNPVLETTKILIEDPKYVFIDKKKLNKIAEKFSKEKLEIPRWNSPVYIEQNDKKTIDFF